MSAPVPPVPPVPAGPAPAEDPREEQAHETTAHETTAHETLVELREVGKVYGSVTALSGVDLTVRSGEVTCVLGDNGAGKSTLIKILAGLHPHDAGQVLVGGEPVLWGSPRQALDAGIATVYQDLALAPLMSVWRNFFLGHELRRGPLRLLDAPRMRRVADDRLRAMGIELPDLDRPVGSLSGGQRQCVAIARAIHLGAKVLILDEPTAALGVRQSGIVLRHVARARDAGLGIVLITHNPHHAYLVGDHFLVLKLGRVALDVRRDEITVDELAAQMSGGDELAELGHELRSPAR